MAGFILFGIALLYVILCYAIALGAARNEVSKELGVKLGELEYPNLYRHDKQKFDLKVKNLVEEYFWKVFIFGMLFIVMLFILYLYLDGQGII